MSDQNDSLNKFRSQIYRWFFGSNLVISLLSIGLIFREFWKTPNETNNMLIAIVSFGLLTFFILGRWQSKKLLQVFGCSWVEINENRFLFYHETNGVRHSHLEILKSENWKVLKLRHVHAYQIEAPIWPSFPFFKKTHIISIATNDELAEKILSQIFKKI